VAGGLRQRIHEWTRSSPADSAPRDQPEPAAAPAPADPPDVPAPATGAAPSDQPPAAAAPAPPSHRADGRPPVTDAEKPRASQRRAARHRRTPRFAPPPATRSIQISPTEAPPLNGGAFEIAPPTPLEKRRDLAPPTDDTVPLTP
jgi:hypothetical protein